MSKRPQEASRTCREGCKPTETEGKPTRKKNIPQKYDDYWLGSATRQHTENHEPSDEESETISSGLRQELKRRGIQNNLNSVKQLSDEETDIEIIHERKNILMTEMEHIFERLLKKENGMRKNPNPSSEVGEPDQ